MRCELTVNGIRVAREADGKLTLLRFLREELGLMGTKNGCEQGHCGACTVVVDGKAQRACLLRMERLQGASVLTVEGLAPRGGGLHPIQQAFADEGAVQCGFCTPGMIMAAKALLDVTPDPTDEEIKHALRFNICRCTGYAVILRAVHRATRLLAGQHVRLSAPPKPPALAALLPDGGVGKGLARVDIEKKVRGLPFFADDYIAPRMLAGKLKFSDYAHARIVSIDTAAAEQAPGVALVLTANDVPGRNAFGLFRAEQPVFAEKEVKYLGEPVAAVFAETREQAEAARDLIKVEYERLPALLSPFDAAKPGSMKVHESHKDNLAHEVHVRKGDVDAAFARADVVVEGDYDTPAIEHAYLEPESCLAVPDEAGGLTVYTCNQGSVTFQQSIAASLAIPEERVRVVLTPCGGGFGGKEEPTVQIQAALAAVRIGRPVKLTLTRMESIRMSTKRHPMHIHMKHGATKDGKVIAVQSHVVADGGAYLSMTQPVIFRSAVICTGPYEVENVKADSYGYYTHHNPSGAFRGFGSTQATFGAEVQMDKLARALGMSPVELRRKNALTPGKQTCTGQVLHSGVGYLGTLEDVASRFERMRAEYGGRPRPAHVKFGVGLASAYKNVGIGTGLPDGAGAVVELLPTGRVWVRHGAAEMGQGCDTVAAQVAATELRLPYALFDVTGCDTATCPDGGMTTASRQTYVTGNAVKQTAALLYARLRPYLEAVRSKADEAALREVYRQAKADGAQLCVGSNYLPPKTYKHRTDADHHPGEPAEVLDIHYAFCFVTVGAAVEVDTQTGEVRVLKIIASQDVGRALNPQNVIGQIEGAANMGMGFALSEQFLEDETHVITDTYKKLRVPTFENLPDIEAFFVEEPDDGGPYGAKGIGEVGLNPMAPAISNAVFDAVGVRAQSLPMAKEKILALLTQKERGK